MSVVRVGILSDTHGSLCAAAIDALAGVDYIIHAGDIGGSHVLIELEAIAPVVAVEGNMDRHGSLPGLAEREAPLIAGVRFVVVHDVTGLASSPLPADTRVVVSGHTHVAHVSCRGEVLFVNPGSPSQPRRGGPSSVAILELEGAQIEARIVAL